MAVELAQASCGTSVPEMRFVRGPGEDELAPFYDEMGEAGLHAFWEAKNITSIDGKPTGIFGEAE